VGRDAVPMPPLLLLLLLPLLACEPVRSFVPSPGAGPCQILRRGDAPGRNAPLGARSASHALISRRMAEELVVTLHPDGRVSLQVNGVKGEACRELTEELMKELGEVIYTENTEVFASKRMQAHHIRRVH
jgi:hypothetical protein